MNKKQKDIDRKRCRQEFKKRIKRYPRVYLYEKSAFENDSRAFGGLVVVFKDSEPGGRK